MSHPEPNPRIVRWTLRLENAMSLDRPVQALEPSITSVFGSGRRSRLLRDEWLGHAVHSLIRRRARHLDLRAPSSLSATTSPKPVFRRASRRRREPRHASAITHSYQERGRSARSGPMTLEAR